MSLVAFDNLTCSNRTGTTMPCSISFLDRSSTPDVVVCAGDRKFGMVLADANRSDRRNDDFGGGGPCSSSSSSIGQNSDEVDGSSGMESDEEEEVQSPLRIIKSNSRQNKSKVQKRDQSFNNLDALQESLPFRKGISRFYNGKSKSFASLGDTTAAPCIKDIAKPENAYSRRKRNLLAYTLLYSDKNGSNSSGLRRGGSLLKIAQGGGISKKQAVSSPRSTLALAVAMNTSESNLRSNNPAETNWGTLTGPSTVVSGGGCTSHSNVGLSPSPLVQRNMHPWRSFSVMDLQHCAVTNGSNALTCGGSCLPTSSINDQKKSDQVS